MKKSLKVYHNPNQTAVRPLAVRVCRGYTHLRSLGIGLRGNAANLLGRRGWGWRWGRGWPLSGDLPERCPCGQVQGQLGRSGEGATVGVHQGGVDSRWVREDAQGLVVRAHLRLHDAHLRLHHIHRQLRNVTLLVCLVFWVRFYQKKRSL